MGCQAFLTCSLPTITPIARANRPFRVLNTLLCGHPTRNGAVPLASVARPRPKCQPAVGLRTSSTSGHSRRNVVARSGADSLAPLGYDFLTFLASTVLVVPLFKRAKLSPVLGFLLSGVVLNQLGLFRSVEEIEKLGELGVLFLLFEMGLELSVDRLKALSRYAFGMGLLQMVLCTGVFTAFALPVGHGLGSYILEQIFGATPSLVGIRSVDEAVVIGYALSLSSSAFVLQLLAERGELPTKFGSATLGILLFQDIAVVPFLVLLPQLEQDTGTEMGMSMLMELWPQALTGVGFLGLLLFAGRVILRRVFETVAASKSPETFVAACLLTVTGCSAVSQEMGFSDTLGAFLAGVLLAETNFRTQVEADIRAFRGILLGLFFVTTGASMDLNLLLDEWPVVLALVVGLIGVKSLLISAIGPLFGLSRSESVRTGLLMSQGGEFAFVLLSLANSLGVLPPELNKLLIIVVVISMALTPALADLSKYMGGLWETTEPKPASSEVIDAHGIRPDAVAICGFGQMGQVVANMLDSPLSLVDNPSFIAFDLDPVCVNAARSMGFPVYYADASRPEVLETVGVTEPRAIVVLYSDPELALGTVRSYRKEFKDVPIYAHSVDLWQAAKLRNAGATHVISSSTDIAVSMGNEVLREVCNASERDAEYLGGLVKRSLQRRVIELQAAQVKIKKDKRAVDTQMQDMQQELSLAFSSSGEDSDAASVSSKSSETTETPLAQQLEEDTRAELIEILGGTPPQQVAGEKYKDLGYACGEGSETSPAECIDLSIRPATRRSG